MVERLEQLGGVVELPDPCIVPATYSNIGRTGVATSSRSSPGLGE